MQQQTTAAWKFPGDEAYGTGQGYYHIDDIDADDDQELSSSIQEFNNSYGETNEDFEREHENNIDQVSWSYSNY